MSEKARLELTPTLFIGLGGTGKMVLSEIRRLFIEHPFFDRQIPGMIDFLSIDSDADSDVYKDEEEALKSLSREETMLVKAQVGDIRDFLGRKPHIKNWFPVQHTRNVELSGRGAKQKRYLGRLAFFASVEGILETLRAKLQKICSRTHVVSDKNVRMSDAANVDIFIVNSLCGGTGSGMFLDLAFVLRELVAETVSRKVAVTGFFLTSEAFHLPGFRENIQRNCASAIMELDYFMNPGHVDFSTRYTDTFSINHAKSAKAFDFAYLINGTEMDDHLEVERTSGHGIFAGVITSAGRAKDSVKDNIVYDAVEKNEGKYTCFSTYGFGSCFYPGIEVSEIFACRFGASLLGNITQKWDNTHKTLNQRFSGLLSRTFPELSQSVTQSLLDRAMTDQEFRQIVPVTRLPEEVCSGENAGQIKNWVKSQEVTRTQQDRLDNRIRENIRKYSTDFLSRLEQEISFQMGDFSMGPGFSRTFLKLFRTQLEEMISSWKQEMESSETMIKKLEYQLSGQLKKLEEISTGFFSMFKKDEITQSLDQIRSLCAKINRAIFDCGRLCAVISGMEQISLDIGTLFVSVVDTLYSSLEEMRTNRLPDDEKAVISKVISDRRRNKFADRIVVEESDIDLSSWFYEKTLYGKGLSQEDIAGRWDLFEKEFLESVEFGRNFRTFSTSPFEFEKKLREYASSRFEKLRKMSIEEFLRDKAEHYYSDSARIKAFYVQILKDLFVSAKPSTLTSDRRGKYQEVYTFSLGVPDAENTVFGQNLTDEAVSQKNGKVNLAGTGFPQRLVLIQTQEAVPVTAVGGIEGWAQAYRTRDRYLHALGDEFGIDWNNHLLVKDSYAVNVKNASLFFFMGMHCGIVLKRKPSCAEEKAYYLDDGVKDDLFSTGPSGISLGDTIEHCIREMCEKTDKLVLLEQKLKNSETYKALCPEKTAEILKDFSARLLSALSRIENPEIRNAYEIINRALLLWVRFYEEKKGEHKDRETVETGFSL